MLHFSNILCRQNTCKMIHRSSKVFCAKTGLAQSLAMQSSTPIFALLLITFHPISFKSGLSSGKRNTAQPFNFIQRASALQCAWMPSWTLPSMAATEPGATWGGGGGRSGWEQEFKGEAKCSALLMAEKVIFYQSISNDDKTPGGASMLYYCLIRTNLGTPIERGWK